MISSCVVRTGVVFSIQALGGARRKTESLDQHGAVGDGPNNAKRPISRASACARGASGFDLCLVNKIIADSPKAVKKNSALEICPSAHARGGDHGRN